MKIVTSRLELHAFTYGELKTVQNLNILHRKVGEVKFDSKTLDDGVLNAISKKIFKMEHMSKKLHPWCTYWGIVLPETNTCIGLIGFKGYPDENGYTEVGYGISPNYRRKGYMSEALAGLVAWAFKNEDCKGITACRVLADNIGSQRVLINNKFVVTSKSEEMINYILLKKS